MAPLKSAYVKLLLYRSPSNRDTWLKCLKETADFYGWLDAYPIWTPPPIAFTASGRDLVAWSGASPACSGGLRLRICRSGRRTGHPRGTTNAFRVSKSISNALLTELAELTKVPFAWMEDKAFRRLTYEDWMSRSEAARQLLASHRAKGAH